MVENIIYILTEQANLMVSCTREVLFEGEDSVQLTSLY
jgi:hypothetical protein